MHNFNDLTIIFYLYFLTDLGELSNEPDSQETKSDRKVGNFNCEEEAAALKRQMERYLSIVPKYAMKRLLSADVKHLYNQKMLSVTDVSQYEHEPLRWLLKEKELTLAGPNTKKGGLRISNLNFNWYVMLFKVAF